MANKAGVETTHPEYDRYICQWIQVDDVIEGSKQVKLKGTQYLPKPDSHVEKCAPSVEMYSKTSDYNFACAQYQQRIYSINSRYGQYLERALFYNFTKRTKDGMVGGVFRKEPIIKLEGTPLEYLEYDVDGNGTDLVQQARVVLDQNLRKGRGGLFVDVPAPRLDGDGNAIPVSQNDIQSGQMAPRIQKYNAEDIINWRTRRIGSVTKVSMIVLREMYEPEETVDPTNPGLYDHECYYQYRVLYINDQGNYAQILYKYQTEGSDPETVNIGEIRANGRTLDYIPFHFFGSEENDFSVDNAPLYDLSVLNIAHYRNSADNEESSFICGQPTLVIAPSKSFGNPEQFTKANPGGVQIGSRQGINVGEGGSANLLQAAENNLAKQNMLDKEQQAIAIGAELITPSSRQTAEAVRTEKAADTSVLASVTKNVQSAYHDALDSCLLFLGVQDPMTVEYEFTLNTDFFMNMPTFQDRAQWVSEVNAGVLPRSEYYNWLRKHELVNAELTDEQIQERIIEEGGAAGGLI